MRVYAPTNAAPAAVARAPRHRAGGAFFIADASAGHPATPAAPPRAAASLDALMAMQGVDDPTERRRRTIKRGRTALDVLDELKIGVLAGAPDPSAVARLRVIAATLHGNSGDHRLDAIMAEIELRAAVELAKYATR